MNYSIINNKALFKELYLFPHLKVIIQLLKKLIKY